MVEEKILLFILGLVASVLLRGKHSLGTVMAELAGVGFCIGVCYLLNQYLPNWGTVSVVRYSRFMLMGYVPGRLVE